MPNDWLAVQVLTTEKAHKMINVGPRPSADRVEQFEPGDSFRFSNT